MQEIQYIGESAWQGVAGHALVAVAFVAALFGAISYFRVPFGSSSRWFRLGRSYLLVHGLSVFGIIGLLLSMMITQRYEYTYVWEHVSEDLPMRYILSAFWEGQEGSFLLWMFWHVVLGFIIAARPGPWRAPVLGVLLSVQVVITSMLLGVYLTDAFKIGVNPFSLLRETMAAPIFARSDYLSLIEGNGLNPLLQNYWMTIHPPTLFLGFASVTIPFCFAIAGLITKRHKEWLRPAMPWALFSAGILGTGILMGGAWAYEALSFGGYWAWDPVENMSLVPWLILVAGLHSNLIATRTGHSLRTAYLFYILSFLLILYSTFLTRSGVLGDTSAHAFTQMGLEWQLVIFMAIFGIASAVLLARSWRSIPVPAKEERIESREFWMFIGTLVLLFSSILISFTTSIPVYNKLLNVVADVFNTDYTHLHRTAPIDPIEHYNKFQMWIAVFIALLSGTAQYMRYREVNWTKYRMEFVRHMAVASLLAAALTVALSAWINVRAWQYWVLLASASFAITANIEYLLSSARRVPGTAASALSHLGFGVMIVGVMASGLNKNVISSNAFAQRGLFSDLDPTRHITLIKNRPMFMNGYWVEYERDTVVNNLRRFVVTYKQIDENADTVKRFTVTPNVVFNNKQTKVEATNPSTKHFLSKDIFTYVAALPGEQMDVEEARRINDTLNFVKHEIALGDTLETEDYSLWVKSVSTDDDHPDHKRLSGDLSLLATIGVNNKGRDETSSHKVMVYLREGLVYGFPAQLNDLNMRVRLSDEAIRQYYVPDSELDYREAVLRQGDAIELFGARIVLRGIESGADNPSYKAVEGDIAVTAALDIEMQGRRFEARPVFYIRGNEPGSIKSFDPSTGMHVRLERIDPASEKFYFRVARDDRDRTVVPIEIAQNVPRTDIIVIEAIVFPGINLFWAGSILMLVGLFFAMWKKRREAKPV